MSQRLDAIAESQLVDGAAQSWLDQLRPASFRGVPFQVDSIEWTAGDNVVVREYPFQDLPTVFRMGAATQEIKFSAYVIGDDYHRQRDALMSALSGRGTLMHPTAGAMVVFVAGKFAVKEALAAEGGMARFDLCFVRADAERRYPAGAASQQAVATSAAGAAKAAAGDDFAAQWVTKGKPGWVAEQAVGRMKDALADVIGPIRTAAAGANAFLAEVNASYRAAVNGLDALVTAPRQLADAVTAIFRLPDDLTNAAARDFQQAFAWGFNLDVKLPRKPFESRVMPPVGAGLVMYGTGIDTASGGSPGQRQVAALAATGDQLIEVLACAAYVEATARIELDSYDEALAMRGVVHDQLMRLMQDASAAVPDPDEVPASSLHDALLALHGAALADLQSRSRDLVRLTTYTPQSWQPVWYVSHRLFGTAAWADELLEMNPHIEHPLLVPPGRPLRVVRHA